MFTKRRKTDEEAWNTWSWLSAKVTENRAPDRNWTSSELVGRVGHVYQRARKGTKAVVHFGSSMGAWDTWWPGKCPTPGEWVMIQTHLWWPPGTHSGRPVLWVDTWRANWPTKLDHQAGRHQHQLEKLARRAKRADAGPQPLRQAGGSDIPVFFSDDPGPDDEVPGLTIRPW